MDCCESGGVGVGGDDFATKIAFLVEGVDGENLEEISLAVD